MKKKTLALLKNSGITPYIWTILTILPFYFIFQSSSTIKIIIGIVLTSIFIIVFRLAFIVKKWPVYLCTSMLIAISITMVILFQYLYFAFFIAYYNGNIKSRMAFLTLYIIHLICVAISISFIVIFHNAVFITQLPFIIIIAISVILLPFNLYNRKKQEKLEQQLEYANNRIAELVKQEERQRIARDLHDTLGQKLSLIGLKSDLARKLVYKNPEEARNELRDVQQTARTALNEVRQMVSQMRGIRVKDELVRIKQLLKAAQIDFHCNQEEKLSNVSLFLENILSMCMKEAVTNIVKHSQASSCRIMIEQTSKEICIIIQDNGIGIDDKERHLRGSGLLGMKERLEFVNGNLEVISNQGTTLKLNVPTVIRKM